jgi:hypothetical protein
MQLSALWPGAELADSASQRLAVLQVDDRPAGHGKADRSLVAEDRTAQGVRDQTGPGPRCSRNCSRDAPRHLGMSQHRTRRRHGVRPAQMPERGQDSTSQHTACAI